MSTQAPVVALSRFRAAMGQALARRGQALLESETLAEDVAQLGVTELYFIIKELGVDEALPLLLSSGPGRLQALCDFDCWDKDTFDAVELDVWLAPFAAEGPEALAQAFVALDEELQVLFLQQTLEVYEGPANDNPDLPADRPSREVPGGLFTLVAKETAGEVDALKLTDALMAHSMEELFRLLTALKWELPSTLTEQAYQFRQSRMMDLGFMAPEEAARLFAAPPKVLGAGPAAEPVPQAMPALYAHALMDDQALIYRALAGITDARDVARIESALVYLINGSVVAWDVTVRNLKDVHDVAGWVANVLSLALEALCADAGADLDGRLTGTVLSTPLLHLFQRGMSEIRPLATRAQRLGRRPEVRAWLDAAAPADETEDKEAHDRAFLAGLVSIRPYWGGADALDARKRTMWRSQADLVATSTRLGALEARWHRDDGLGEAAP
jgi:hypothetical protein